MESPYIKLSQPNIEPMVLEKILEDVWNELSDKAKERVIDNLKDNEIQFEI